MARASWQAGAGEWQLQASIGVFAAKFVIFECGPMHVPSFPAVQGLDSFRGDMFH
jgi:cation diffusion facilitator CzcD-associated flavoprotein CzcO